MGAKKSLLELRHTKVSAGAAYDDLKSDRPKAGEVWCIQNAAVENETNNTTLLRIFIEGRGYEHFLDEQLNPLAAHLFTLPRDVFIHEGEMLVARFTGCTSGDKLAMYLSGYRQNAS